MDSGLVQLCGLRSDGLRKDANRWVSSLAPYVWVMSMHLRMGGQCLSESCAGILAWRCVGDLVQVVSVSQRLVVLMLQCDEGRHVKMRVHT